MSLLVEIGGGAPMTQARRPRFEPHTWLLIIILLGIMGFPLALLLTSAFNSGDPQAIPPQVYGLDAFQRLWEYRQWIFNTFVIAIGGMVFATLSGSLIAWILHRALIPFSGIFTLLIALPYPLGPLVGGLAWSRLGSPSDGLLNVAYECLTGRSGPLIDINTVWGIMFVEGLYETPVAALLIGAAMKRMDPALEECSSVLGAGRLKTALLVTLPLMAPAILSVALFLFSSMLGAFAIPAILGMPSRYYTATTAIFALVQGYPPDYPLAAALGIILIITAMTAVWLYGKALSTRSYAIVSGRSYRPRRFAMGQLTPVLVSILSLFVLLSLVLPLSVLLLASVQRTGTFNWDYSTWTLRNYEYVLLTYPTTREAIFNSLILGVATGILAVLLATVIALLIRRSKTFASLVLEQVTMLPQTFPHFIFAFGFLWMILALPFPIYGTLYAVLLVYIIIFLPLAYRGMSGVVVQINPALQEAARVSGAGQLQVLATITLPLLKPGLAATGLLIFMISIREVGASIFLSGAGTFVLGPTIFKLWDTGGIGYVSALAMVQAAMMLAVVAFARAFTGGEAKI